MWHLNGNQMYCIFRQIKVMTHSTESVPAFNVLVCSKGFRQDEVFLIFQIPKSTRIQLPATRTTCRVASTNLRAFMRRFGEILSFVSVKISSQQCSSSVGDYTTVMLLWMLESKASLQLLSCQTSCFPLHTACTFCTKAAAPRATCLISTTDLL